MTIQEKNRIYFAGYRARNREKLRVYHRAWSEAHRTKPRQQRLSPPGSSPAERSKIRYEKKGTEIREFYRHHHLKKAYGMSMGDLHRLLATQNFKCAICQNEIDEFTRAIDHCHETKRVRGLLCRNCNTAIGLLKDNSFIVIAAARYLMAVGEKK